ncbi:MAG: hypothetical protein OXF31_00870 [Gammaproteobacteria bacterium]|nr:hypothetical protein [Gammaproteobacteria bacterium]
MNLVSFLGFAVLLAVAAAFLFAGAVAWRRLIVVLIVLAALSWLIYLEIGALPDMRVQAWMKLVQQGETFSAGQRSAFRGLLEDLGEDEGGERYAFLLGHDYLNEEQYEYAREVFAGLQARGVEDREVDLAFVHSDFLARGGVLGRQARDLAERLADSNNPVLLEMLVLDALRSNDQQAFMRHWPSYSTTPRGAQLGERLGWSEAPESDDEVAIEVSVSAAAAIFADADTPVFVLARQFEASGPPLAVKRLTFADLPSSVRLTDQDAMLETNRLSDASRVQVVARIAYSGSAIAAEGDIEVASGAIELSSEDVRVELLIE